MISALALQQEGHQFDPPGVQNSKLTLVMIMTVKVCLSLYVVK